jgi:hypothetical protein
LSERSAFCILKSLLLQYDREYQADSGGEILMKGDEKVQESLQADMEACHKEYENAPKLSDEELDRILKDIRRQVRRQGEEAP